MSSGGRALVLLNRSDQPFTIAVTGAELGLGDSPTLEVRDLWAHSDRTARGVVQGNVPPHGATMFIVRAGR